MYMGLLIQIMLYYFFTLLAIDKSDTLETNIIF